MSETFDVILRGGDFVNLTGRFTGDVGVRDGRIAAMGNLASSSAASEIDVRGLTVLPGVIDTQVHFREPGGDLKEDLESGSRSAVLGGVTAVFEMPNTNPMTTTVEAFDDKIRRAHARMHTDHAFYVGATAENAHTLADLEARDGCAGVKVFMGSSTGGLLVSDDETLLRVLKSGTRRVAVHAEDEDRLNARKDVRRTGDPSSHPDWRDVETALLATKRLVTAARTAGRRIHVLHITTKDEMEYLAGQKDIATVETTPQHLTLASPDCYEAIGTRAQMNPPIRSHAHRDGLWWGVEHGVVDVLGSDHAPHTLEEKARDYPNSPSGMPGVQTLLPVMLDHVAAGRLSLERLIDLTSSAPQRVFGLRDKGRMALGWHADFTVVDLKKEWTITDAWSASRCGWTPFDGMRITGKPIGTIIRGQRVMWEDTIVTPSIGEPIRFLETGMPS